MKWPVWIAVGLLLIAAAIRISGLARDVRLQPDEALFADRSRQMVVQGDPFLYDTLIDKPPTTFAFVGSSLALVGENEFAARLPNVFFSLIGLATLYAIGRQLGGHPMATVSLTLGVLAPLEAYYAPSVFQDTPMLTLTLVAIWHALRGKWGLAGGFIGWAVVTKPTALWMLPPVIMLALIQQPAIPWCNFLQRIMYFLRAFMIPVVTVFLWDTVRRTHFLRAGLGNNNPGRFIRSDEVMPRAEQWLEFLGQLTSYPAVMILLGGLIVVWLGLRLPRPQRRDLIGWLMVLYAIAYLGAYWLAAFNTYDRYVLLIGPLVWLAGGMAVVSLVGEWSDLIAALVITMLLIGVRPALDAAHQDTAPDLYGIDELSDTLNRDYGGRIVYDYWLGWELGWYLGGDTMVRVVYFPTPEDLADHLRTETGERFFVAPSTEHAALWLDLLAKGGVKTTLVYQTTESDFVLYSVLPPHSTLAQIFG